MSTDEMSAGIPAEVWDSTAAIEASTADAPQAMDVSEPVPFPGSEQEKPLFEAEAPAVATATDTSWMEQVEEAPAGDTSAAGLGEEYAHGAVRPRSGSEHHRFHHGDEQQPQQVQQVEKVEEEEEEKSERLFVTKVPRDAVEKDLVDYFSQYGNVVDCHMPRIPGRPGHKGIAFVSYDDCDVAASVRAMGGHFLYDQELVVDRATTRDPNSGERKRAERLETEGKKGGFSKGFGKKGKGKSWGNDSWGNDNWNQKGGNNWGQQDNWGGKNQGWNKDWNNKGSFNPKGKGKSQTAMAPIDNETRIFVTKISPAITKDNIVEYFSQFGNLSDCYVPNSNQPGVEHKGIAFLSFDDAEITTEVLSRPQYEVKPQEFVVVDQAQNRSGGNNNGGADWGKGGGASWGGKGDWGGKGSWGGKGKGNGGWNEGKGWNEGGKWGEKGGYAAQQTSFDKGASFGSSPTHSNPY